MIYDKSSYFHTEHGCYCLFPMNRNMDLFIACIILSSKKQSEKSEYNGGSVVKKVIVGSVMFMTGIISAIVLLGGAMAYQFEHINLSPFAMTMQILAAYGLTPFLYVAVVIAVIGVIVTILGLKEK